jgi:hypothetical protein
MVCLFIHSLSSIQRHAAKKRDKLHIRRIYEYSLYRAMLALCGIGGGKASAYWPSPARSTSQRNRSHIYVYKKCYLQSGVYVPHCDCWNSLNRFLKMEHLPSGIQESSYKDSIIFHNVGQHSLKQDGVAVFKIIIKRMEQGRSWEANRRSASKNIFYLCGTRRYFAMFTDTHRWTSCWVRYITTYHLIPLKTI